MKKITLSFVLLLAFMSSFQSFATDVSGLITSNTTWTVANSPYFVRANVLVTYGNTLTIQPGVTVKFDSAMSIQVDGALIAQGNSASGIMFTSNTTNTAGAWGYIYFSDLSTDAVYQGNVYSAYSSGCILEYCTIEYAGSNAVANNGAIKLENAHPFINHCTIRNNKASGIRANNLSSDFKISNCLISSNTSIDNGGGIFINNNTSSTSGTVLITNNTINDNTATADGGGVFANVQNSRTLVITSNIIDGNTAMNGAGICNSFHGNAIITDNVVINNTGLGSYGGGIYNSTFANSLVKNNVIANNQLTSTTANAGAGVSIVNQSATQLFNNVIADNSATNSGGGILNMQSASSIKNNHVVNNTAHDQAGINLNNSINDSVWSNTFVGNTNTNTINANNACMYFTLDYPTISKNNVFGNACALDLYCDDEAGTSDIFAPNNWWGANTYASISALIFDNVDNSAMELVNFTPFFIQADTLAPIAPPTAVSKANIGGGQVHLTWASNTEFDLAGYHIYYGGFNGYSFTNMITVGAVTSYTITGSITDTYAVTAFDNTYATANENATTLVNDNMMNGNESWYGFAHANCNGLAVSVASTIATCLNCANGSATATVVGGTSPYTYLWNTNPPQTTSSITNIFPANYTVLVTDYNGCSQSTSVVVGYNTNGITEFDNTAVGIYPNPANDLVHIDASSLSSQEYSISLFTLSGQKLKSELVNGAHSKLNVNDVPNGMYLLELRTKSGLKNQKLIINR